MYINFLKVEYLHRWTLHISCEFHHKGHPEALRDILTVGWSLSPSLQVDVHPTEFELIVILTQVNESKLVILLLTRVRILVTWECTHKDHRFEWGEIESSRETGVFGIVFKSGDNFWPISHAKIKIRYSETGGQSVSNRNLTYHSFWVEVFREHDFPNLPFDKFIPSKLST